MKPLILDDHEDATLSALRCAQAWDAASELHEHQDAPDHHCVACGVCLSPLAQQDCGTCLGVAA